MTPSRAITDPDLHAALCSSLRRRGVCDCSQVDYHPTDEAAVFVRYWPNTVHLLKTVEPYFRHVKLDWKPFEVRRDDRGFQAGDLLLLAEWDGDTWTGQDCVREVVYVLRDAADFGVQEGFVVLGLKPPDWRSISHRVLAANDGSHAHG